MLLRGICVLRLLFWCYVCEESIFYPVYFFTRSPRKTALVSVPILIEQRIRNRRHSPTARSQAPPSLLCTTVETPSASRRMVNKMERLTRTKAVTDPSGSSGW